MKRNKSGLSECEVRKNGTKKQKKIPKKEKEYFGYTNEDNPFNDSNLSAAFVWKKKYTGMEMSREEIKSEMQMRLKTQNRTQSDLEQIFEEIQKTKQRRKEREAELEAQEILKMQLQREMEFEQNNDWQIKEETFFFANALKRSEIRLRNHREKCIDILVQLFNAKAITEDLKEKIRNPITFMEQRMSKSQLNELITQINEFIEAYINGNEEEEEEEEEGKEGELNANHKIEMWKHARVYAKHCLLMESQNQNQSISTKMESIQCVLSSYRNNLQSIIDKCEKIVSGTTNGGGNVALDVEFWETTLKIAKVELAKQVIFRKYKQLKFEDKKTEQEPNLNVENTTNTHMSSLSFPIPEVFDTDYISESEIPFSFDLKNVKKMYSNASIITYESDEDELEMQRMKVLKSKLETTKTAKATNTTKTTKTTKTIKTAKKTKVTKTDKLIPRNAQIESEMYQKMVNLFKDDENSYTFNQTCAIPTQNTTVHAHTLTTQWWHDKYKPRKPRYFNRVKTGYAWNKYNQTHYDPENPPPKIVQGYKFNVFYPDLIQVDGQIPCPSYKVYESVRGNNEYCTIVFHAGPPYEDIAFKIVNNEWETNHKKGFRCRFEKGIFSLYFNFKRYRYRK